MLCDGTAAADVRLGRCVQFDPRSRLFPARAVLGRAEQTERTRLWYLPTTAWVFDQGQQGSCVGMGVTNELRFTPRAVRGLDQRFAVERIYWEAQKIDEWDGGAYPGADLYYEGTSVLAGVKAAAALGYYAEYRWAFGEQDLALAVGHIGPAVLGLPWHEGMLTPDLAGRIYPTGEVIGGHCVLAIGINARSGVYTIANSWGAGWGQRGRAYITRAHMAELLANQGEAVVITRRTTPKRGQT